MRCNSRRQCLKFTQPIRRGLNDRSSASATPREVVCSNLRISHVATSRASGDSDFDAATGSASITDYNAAMSDVTRILVAVQSGDEKASDKLLPLVYQELRRLAAAKLSKEKPGQTLQPTMLVHEAYVRLVDVDEPQEWNGRGHFFAAAAEAMRRIIVENARRKLSQRGGGDRARVELDAVNLATEIRDGELVALDEALALLEDRWPDKAKLVKLRYFVGMTIPEAAAALGISHATAERHWKFAKAWLHAQLANRQ